MSENRLHSETATLWGAGLLQHIINYSRDAVIVISSDDLLIYDVAQKTCSMLGRSREELIGAHLSTVECSLQDLFFWDDIRQTPEFVDFRLAESEWLTSDGRVLPIEKRVSSFTNHGEVFWVIHAEDITNKRLVSEEQIHLASQLQSSLEATAEGILSIDLRGNVINLNRRFIAMWNIPEEVLMGRQAEAIIACMQARCDDSVHFSSNLLRYKTESEAETADQVCLLDGRYFDVVSKPEFYRDQLIGRVFSVRDITDMKTVENNLTQMRDVAELANQEKTRMLDAVRISESRLRRLVNSSLVGIIEGDNSGQLVEANDVLLHLLGYDREALESGTLNLYSMIPTIYHHDYRSALDEIELHSQAQPFEIELINSEGGLIPVMLGMSRLEGSDDEWVGFVLDLTEQKKADKIKSEFIAVVSHELRTPLTSIRGALGLLEHSVGTDFPPKLMQLLKIAHKNSQRLGTLVNDLLDIEKLVSGKMDISMDRIDLIKLTQQAIEANAPYAQQYNVKYELSSFPESAWAVCDADRVMQVYANLMSNAAKFSHPKGVVCIRIIDESDMFRIEVEDKGQGIPKEFHDRVFMKFAQADGGNTRKQGGTGLGLNISKTFVEKMGGSIGFDSTEGQGTTFWFTLTAGVRRRGES